MALTRIIRVSIRCPILNDTCDGSGRNGTTIATVRIDVTTSKGPDVETSCTTAADGRCDQRIASSSCLLLPPSYKV